MKKLHTKNTKTNSLFIALTLISASLMTSFSVQAQADANESVQNQTHAGETELDHKVLAGIVAEFSEYGKALRAFNDNFFGVIPNKFTKNQFIDLAQKLRNMIFGIKERTIKYQAAITGQESKKIMGEFEKLAEILKTSSQNLLETLQKTLGTKNLLVGLKRLSDAESKKIPQLLVMQKSIGLLLEKHTTNEIVQQFSQFVNHIAYTLAFPGNNRNIALAIAVRYSSLK